ncbi:hypothetical protein [Streptomyces sp. NPDC048659]|uniref:HAAS signaling domain-containing protein n=1 Tax=Streptomyces sp. NPDC048659 TaxID=3155489 RepID=UPI003437A034
MNAIDHPLVTAYLDAVARETSVLPAERRAELLADLREHVEVSGAASDDEVRAVLAGLGDPRAVAASALAEEPHVLLAPAAPPVSRTRVRVTVGLLALAGLLSALNAFVGTTALIIGLVLLWGSPVWDRRQKTIGTVSCAIVPLALVAAGFLLAGGRLGPIEVLLIIAVSLIAPIAGATTLLRAARR